MMDMETRWLAGLLDPFCDQAVEDAIRYWTPTEKNNLLHSHPLIVKEIEELLAKFNSEQKNPLFPSSYDAPIMIDKYDGKEYEEGDEYIYWSN